jgi:hypothetical protein
MEVGHTVLISYFWNSCEIILQNYLTSRDNSIDLYILRCAGHMNTVYIISNKVKQIHLLF